MSDEPSAPVAGAPRPARRELPRRFYEAAAVTPVGDGFGLTLDGKQAKTPGRNPLVVAESAVAQALAAEWGRQGERIDPATMPLTRIVHSAIDRVAGEMEPVKAEIVKYAGSDLVCYRGEGPESLVAAQEAAWGPVLAWAREALGARFVLAEGIIAVEQPAESLAAVASALADLDPLQAGRRPCRHHAHRFGADRARRLARRASPRKRRGRPPMSTRTGRWSSGAGTRVALSRRAARWQDMQAAALILEADGR